MREIDVCDGGERIIIAQTFLIGRLLFGKIEGKFRPRRGCDDGMVAPPRVSATCSALYLSILTWPHGPVREIPFLSFQFITRYKPSPMT